MSLTSGSGLQDLILIETPGRFNTLAFLGAPGGTQTHLHDKCSQVLAHAFALPTFPAVPGATSQMPELNKSTPGLI